MKPIATKDKINNKNDTIESFREIFSQYFIITIGTTTPTQMVRHSDNANISTWLIHTTAVINHDNSIIAKTSPIVAIIQTVISLVLERSSFFNHIFTIIGNIIIMHRDIESPRILSISISCSPLLSIDRMEKDNTLHKMLAKITLFREIFISQYFSMIASRNITKLSQIIIYHIPSHNIKGRKNRSSGSVIVVGIIQQ